jgi:hypothetical protein
MSGWENTFSPTSGAAERSDSGIIIKRGPKQLIEGSGF